MTNPVYIKNMINKILHGNKIILCGDRKTIIGLHNSAFNWNAIGGTKGNISKDDEDIKEIGPNFCYFIVPKRNLFRWRMNAEMASFDCERLVSFKFLRMLARRVKKWFNDLAVISNHEFWNKSNNISFYSYSQKNKLQINN